MSASIHAIGTQKPLPIIPAQSIPEAVTNLLRDGWTRLECPGLGRRHEQVIANFIGMCNDPNRDAYAVHDQRELDPQGEPDLGLVYRSLGQKKNNPRPDEVTEERTMYDQSKFFMHFHPRYFGYIGRTPGLIEKHRDFFLHATRMHAEANLLLFDIAEEMDRRMPGFNFLARTGLGQHWNVLRLLHYLCDGPRPDIAQRHRDRCFLTVHIRSSRGGLWFADNKDRIVSNAEETRANSVLLFFGREAWDITQGAIQGIVHGVHDTMFNDLLSRTSRQTSVFFGHAHVHPQEQAWALDHMGDLKIPEHVEAHARGSK